MVVVTEDDKVLTVENPDKLQGHEAQHVEITGHLRGTSLHTSKASRCCEIVPVKRPGSAYRDRAFLLP